MKNSPTVWSCSPASEHYIVIAAGMCPGTYQVLKNRGHRSLGLGTADVDVNLFYTEDRLFITMCLNYLGTDGQLPNN